jgi:hypothetical protein
MTLDECLALACEQVPGLHQGALALLPEGLLIGGVGVGSSFEREPLVRSAARCLAANAERAGALEGESPFIEHVFVSLHELVVIARGKRYPRLALALSCSMETNLAFVLSASRAALRELEATIDVQGLEI